MNSGIYKIINTVNNDFYVGSSKNLEKRKKQHFNALRKNKHCNLYLQHAWNKYGEQFFVFEIILLCPQENLLNLENSFLDKQPTYNIVKTALGGDTISNNPKKNEIIEKAKITRKSKERSELDKNKYYTDQ